MAESDWKLISDGEGRLIVDIKTREILCVEPAQCSEPEHKKFWAEYVATLQTIGTRIMYGTPQDMSFTAKTVIIMQFVAEKNFPDDAISENVESLLYDLSIGVPNWAPQGISDDDYGLVVRAHLSRCLNAVEILTGDGTDEAGIEPLHLPEIRES